MTLFPFGYKPDITELKQTLKTLIQRLNEVSSDLHEVSSMSNVGLVEISQLKEAIASLEKLVI